MDKEKVYYKYRSLNGKNWEFLLDIILNNRLYCAKYYELNDPMEGFYRTRENLPQNLRHDILNRKSNFRICSLANEDTNKLLWAHYANGCKGVVIGIKTKESVQSVIYEGLNELDNLLIRPNQDISSIFLHKLKEWNYENESRIILDTHSEYVEIKVVEIIFGLRTNQNTKDLLASLIKGLNRKIIIKQQNREFENVII
jgi:hypothetical protein